MQILKAATVFVMLASGAEAACYKIGTLTTCDDGSSYNTMGNTTFGNNTRTGSSWNQTTTGNYTYGSDSDGNYWSQTRTANGVFGTDSDGNAYSCYEQYDGTMTCY